MEPGQVEPDRLAYILRKWCNNKREFFYRWEFNELYNEAFIAAHHIAHRYNPTKGSYAAFLFTSLYCPVSRSYFKHTCTQCSQPRSGGVRVYRTREFTVDELPEVPWYDTHDEHQGMLNETHPDWMHLIARGLTQRQVGRVVQVSESRISQRLKQARQGGEFKQHGNTYA